MYNVKHLQYPDGYETRVYTRTYSRGVKPVYQDVLFLDNPFTGKEGNYPFDYILSDEEIEHRKERSLMVSKKRAVNNIYNLARCNEWLWFVTMTFNPQLIDSFDYDVCSSKLSQWLKDLRKSDSSLMYLFVPEQHKSGAWHFHGLITCENASALRLSDSGKRDRSGKVIYNIGRYRYGFTTATDVENNEAVTKYITKYVTKDMLSHIKGKKHFWASRNLSRPRIDEEFLDAGEIRALTGIHEDLGTSMEVNEYFAGDVTTPQCCWRYRGEGEYI